MFAEAGVGSKPGEGLSSPLRVSRRNVQWGLDEMLWVQELLQTGGDGSVSVACPPGGAVGVLPLTPLAVDQD